MKERQIWEEAGSVEQKPGVLCPVPVLWKNNNMYFHSFYLFSQAILKHEMLSFGVINTASNLPPLKISEWKWDSY